MKFKKAIIAVILLTSSYCAAAQNLFPEVIKNCHTSNFWLDEGEPKASYEKESFRKMIKKINSVYYFAGIRAKIAFQVLVDSTGTGCVISHTDTSKNALTSDIIGYLNACKWTPAIVDGKPAASSIIIGATIENEKFDAELLQLDLGKMTEKMKNPGTPEIYNKSYVYRNASLSDYEFRVWQTDNSAMPGNMSVTSATDQRGVVWYSTYEGFIKFENEVIIPLDSPVSPIHKTHPVRAIGADDENNLWVSSDERTWKYDGKVWQALDSTVCGFTFCYSIVSSGNGETLFAADNGLFILKNGKWTQVSKSTQPAMPSDRVLYAYRDKKKRLWIGTFSGSIMIDPEGTVTLFNETNTPLKNSCISNMQEDEEQNLYFGLYQYKSGGTRNKDQEGLAVLTKENTWEHYNHKNSGLPANHLNSLLYDRFEKILWIATNEAGLVRYDRKNNSWENYHNKNSAVPSSYIFDLSQDQQGNIYASTFYGMLRIRRK